MSPEVYRLQTVTLTIDYCAPHVQKSAHSKVTEISGFLNTFSCLKVFLSPVKKLFSEFFKNIFQGSMKIKIRSEIFISKLHIKIQFNDICKSQIN